MSTNRCLLGLSLTLLVAACAPVTTYTDAEAPKSLKLDSSTRQVDLRFVPGSAHLTPADAARLQQLAATRAIGPDDRITIAAAGPPVLAEQRVATVASLLLHYHLVAITEPLQVPPEHAVLEVTRSLVTLPPCPNWSKPSSPDFANQPSSNFGCATESNLGMMVARPTDLAGGLPAGAPAAHPAVAAVTRYLTDNVQLPAANSALPVPSGSSAAPGNGGNAGGGTPASQ
jgi:pilus assembly protein CpaD